MSQIPVSFIKPVGQDRYGEKWDAKEVSQFVAGDILAGNHMERRAKDMTVDFEKAAKVSEDAMAMFDKAHKSMMAAQERASEAAKKTSGQVREAANKLSDGLQRIEKTANFDKLERYVTLLERAATAMQTLAELEKDGKLERIANAVK